MERPPGTFFDREFQTWEVGFTKRTRTLSRLAGRAWERIKNAGGKDEALRLLFEYDKAEERLPLLLPHLRRLTYLARAYRREARRALSVTGKAVELRLRRCGESLEALLSAPWPFTEARAPYLRPKEIAGVKTVRDAVYFWPDSFPHEVDTETGRLRQLPQEYAAFFARRADNLRRFGGKPMLLILRDRMAKRGVHLGAGEILALAHCARPSNKLERKNLAHFFKSPDMQSAAADFAREVAELFGEFPTQQ